MAAESDMSDQTIQRLQQQYDKGDREEYGPLAGPGEDVSVPGVKSPVNVSAETTGAGALTKQQAYIALAKKVLGTPGVVKVLKEIFDFVIRNPEDHGDKKLESEEALWILWEESSPSVRKAIQQYLAEGLEYPIGLSKKGEELYYAFMLLDGVDAKDIDVREWLDSC